MTFIQYYINKEKKSYSREKKNKHTQNKTTNSKLVGHKHTTYIIKLDSQKTNSKYIKKKRFKKAITSP